MDAREPEMLGDWACVGQVVQFQGMLKANANVGSKRGRWKQTPICRFDLHLERQKEEFLVKTKEIRGLKPPNLR